MRMMVFLMAASVPAALLGRSELAGPSAPAREAHQQLDRVTACQACHGTDGFATFGPAPNLAGQKAAYLQAQLRAFRQGSRKSDFMNPIAAQLSDGEIVALAAHFASLPRDSAASTEARAASAVGTKVRLPTTFPSHFREYARAEDKSAGTVAISFASDPLVAALKSGARAPEGSMIVVETTAAKRDASGELEHDAGGRLVPGGAQSYSVSATGKGWGELVPATLRNRDWHYAQFDHDGKLRATNQAACLACHRSAAKTDFVFGVQDIRRSSANP
jgi:cytochrome c553